MSQHIPKPALAGQRIKHIKSIKFGLMSKEEILKMSVAEITTNRIGAGSSMPGSVYDPRMGPVRSNEKCGTCNEYIRGCVGHFGHINLNTPIIHPEFCKYMLQFLKTVCHQCARLTVSSEHLELWGLMRLQRDTRFSAIIAKCATVRMCTHCMSTQPRYRYVSNDAAFYAVYDIGQRNTKRIKMSTEEIRHIMLRIPDSDIELMGFDPIRTHPKRLIIEVLPVIPPCSRPFISTSRDVSDDDLTVQYTEIIKYNNYLINPPRSDAKKDQRDKYINNLTFRIHTLMDNSKGKAKHSNSRVIRGIKERLTGKSGQVRMLLLGKRVDHSARTVIGPDPTLRIDEIAIPPSIADTLTYPERVTRHNYTVLMNMLYAGHTNTVTRDSVRYFTEFLLKRDTEFKLQLGDIVERRLQNGDYLILNRQPTLHKGSMLAQRVVRRPGKTIRMNLAITKSFNADFDGDEMNLHAPRSETTRTELELLSSSPQNLISTQASKPMLTIVQDGLLGLYLMTCTEDSMTKAWFQQIACSCQILPHDKDMNRIQRIYDEYSPSTPLYSARTLVSLLFPETFHYRFDNRAMESQPIFEIVSGVIISGALNKSVVSGGSRSIIRILAKEYPCNIPVYFLNHSQFLANAFLMYRGYTVGIEDCLPSNTTEIEQVIAKSYIEACEIKRTTQNEFIRETRISAALNQAKDIGMRLAKEALASDNHFLGTVISGSKGDFFNIAQITGLLGQQNITGNRVSPELNHKTRTLPHYPFDIQEETALYESRGFVSHSFIRGLTPQEFWFHAMSGREGITDTALKTGESGYTQRKMIKIMEDIQIRYDQTVRNAAGYVIQFAYGGDNLDGAETIQVGDKPMFCDVKHLASQYQ